MRRATAALRGHIATFAGWLGVEGVFISAGVGFVAYFAGQFDSRFPLLVIGVALVLYGILLALPEPKRAP